MSPSRRPWTAARVVRGIAKYGPQAVIDCSAVLIAYVLVFGMRSGGTGEARQFADVIMLSFLAGCTQVAANVIFTVYWRNWSLAALEDLIALVKATITQMLVLWIADMAVGAAALSAGVIVLGGALVLVVESALMLRPRWPEILNTALGRQRGANVIVVDAGQTGQALVRELSAASWMRIACFVDDDSHRWGTYVRGIRVEGAVEDLPSLIDKYGPQMVVVATPSPGGAFIRRIVAACGDADVRIRVVQGFGLNDPAGSIRPLIVEELLEREPVELRTREAEFCIRDRTVVVTGAAGSIGSEVARQVATLGPRRLLLLDIDESGLHDTAASIGAGNADICLGDVRDASWLTRFFKMEKPDVLFHAAAYKHVGIVENNPLPAIATNVLGTARVLEASAVSGVERVVFVSTDKAVRPESLMGLTKRFGELLLIAHALELAKPWSVVRFGNVLASRGSVVPIFSRQLDRGGPITVTDPRATRYFMTIPEASGLVINASAIAETGDLLVLDMGAPIAIAELARKMIRLRGLRNDDIAIDFIGLRPGEKLHEELHYPDEILAKSRHDRVHRVVAGPRAPELGYLRRVVDDIEDAVGNFDAETAITLLRAATGVASAQHADGDCSPGKDGLPGEGSS